MPPYRDPGAARRARDRHAPRVAARHTPPPLPAGTVWPSWLAKWWSDVWTSPLTVDWDATLDTPAVARLAGLYLRLSEDAEPTAAVLAQPARLESELGLTPASRKRQHVQARPETPFTSTGQPARRRLKVTDADRLPLAPDQDGAA